MVKKNKEYMSFHEDGKRYMQCKVCQSEYVQTGEDAVAVTCSSCVTRITTSQMKLEDFYPSWKKQKWMSFHEGGKRFMQCKVCKSEYVQTGEDAVAVTCWRCVSIITTSQMSIEDFYPSMKIKKTGRPPGWHFMNEFVDKDGNVFHKGKEQSELKGTLKPTKVKPPKKRKKLTADEKLQRDLTNSKKRKKARKKK